MATQSAGLGADAPADVDSHALSNEGADDHAADAHAERPTDARGARERNKEQRRAPGLLQSVASLASAVASQ